ncbi:GFA family protein [Halodurantibacterium flavum]|uniref:GFA family protein n=1 Tax=Halodurantibacterium flavum TaxID=1382802 RepID=A0ABW4S4Q4_9RHOB
MPETKTGACLCGAISYRVTGPVGPVYFCHCSQCRRQTGHYLASAAVAATDVTISGEENLVWFASSETGRRGFCRSCGSTLFWKEEGGSSVDIAAGSFDQPSGLTPGVHIYVADKGDYYEIGDGLSQYPQSSA